MFNPQTALVSLLLSSFPKAQETKCSSTTASNDQHEEDRHPDPVHAFLEASGSLLAFLSSLSLIHVCSPSSEGRCPAEGFWVWLRDGVAVVGTHAVVSPRRHDDLRTPYLQSQPGRDAKYLRTTRISCELLVLHLEVRVVLGWRF